MLKFKNARTIRADDPYDGKGIQYLITYDYAAGRRDRYTVIKMFWVPDGEGEGCTYEPNIAVIGRELPLGLAKKVAQRDFEASPDIFQD